MECKLDSKTCTRCQTEKPITEFRHPNPKYPEYRASRCRDCERAQDRARYRRYKHDPKIMKRMAKRNAKFREQNRDEINAYAREHMRALRYARMELGEPSR
jgi:hypothetical protein